MLKTHTHTHPKKNMHAHQIHIVDLLCPQESAFVLAKVSPVRNYSSSSPPSSRISPWPVPWPLRTLTLHPGSVEWASCPQCTRSDSCPAEDRKEGEQRIPGSRSIPTSAGMLPDSTHVLHLRDLLQASLLLPPWLPLHEQVHSAVCPLPSCCSSSKDPRRCSPFLC